MTQSLVLPDLEAVIAECKALIKAIDVSLPVRLCPKKADRLVDAYTVLNSGNTITFVGGHTFAIETGDQTRHISVQELPTLSVLAENLSALESYRECLDDVAKEMGFSSRTSGSGKEFFKKLPSDDWKSDVGNELADKLSDAIASVLPDKSNQIKIFRFIEDPDWSGLKDGRKLDRSTDWQESAVLKTGDLVAAASAGRINMIRAIASAGFGSDLVETAKPETLPDTAEAGSGENVIFYGAPGTGKSHHVDRKIANGLSFRTVFHPDLQNSDFFGCLKPQMSGKDVEYRFVPGPFMQALAEASKAPEKQVYLVLEELNRAAAAAVFGDLFLLLDRKNDGTSEYDVSFPSPESKSWFEEETKTSHNALCLPSNLSIYATMNSADQGVFPIDTAFRRRWKQIYLPFDYQSGPDGDVAYTDEHGERHKLAWRHFIRLLNGYLSAIPELEIAEDRLLGQWFVNAGELDGSGIPGKVLIYLWDDLLRHEGRDQVFDTDNVKTYGSLNEKSDHNLRILSVGVLDLLKPESTPDQTPIEQTSDSGE